MKTETKTETIYVSDDGRRRSSSYQEIADYEKRQCLEIFEKRTRITTIGPFSTLYYFQRGDIEAFKDFNTGADIDSKSEDEGFYVYVQDSDYDHIGDDNTLYALEDYQHAVQQQINHYLGILDNITNGTMVHNTLNK